MRTMYKEEVARKKIPVFIGIFILLLLVICITDLIEKVYISERRIGFIANILFFIFMAYAILLSVAKCRERYKYSIIAGQLIIHRISGHEQVVVENIKLKDIEFVGRPRDLKVKYDVVGIGKYTCIYLKSKSYCCIYKYGIKYKKFYFQPSENLIDKLVHYIECEKKMVS